ncbi:MAG: ABC transporter ATP-binding protein [Armatimonadota bacterium]
MQAVDAPLLETRGLTRHFGSVLAVDGVDFAVAAGEIRGVIGPNGAGKTTFFHLMSGVLPPTSGSILLRGRDITRLPVARRVALGLSRSFQITSLFPNLSIADNVRLAAQVRAGLVSIWGTPEGNLAVEEHVRRVLDMVGLSEFCDAQPPQLSHGDQRHLEIALALASRPALLLLDEPTAGMSLAETVHTVDLVRRINREQGVTVVLVEHDMSVILELTHRITVLDRGRILTEGTPAEIAADPKVQEAYLGRQAHAARA